MDLAELSEEGRDIGTKGKFEQVEAASRWLQSEKQRLDARGAGPEEYAKWRNDAGLVRAAADQLEKGNPIPKGLAQNAKNPEIARDLRIASTFEDLELDFERSAESYRKAGFALSEKTNDIVAKRNSLQSTKEQKRGSHQTETKQERPSHAFPPSDKVGISKVGVPPDSEILNARKLVSQSNLEKLTAELDAALSRISSKSLRESLRKKLLQRLRNSPSTSNLEALKQEIVDAARLENLPTAGQSAAAALLDQSTPTTMDRSNIELQEMQDELRRLQDESAGISYDNTKTIFELIRESISSCLRKKCVN